MKLSHELFVELLAPLQLADSDFIPQGLCNGFSMKFAHYFVEHREKDFFSILNTLSGFTKKQQLISAIQKDEQLLGFFRDILIYQNPTVLTESSGLQYSQHQFEEISKSQKLSTNTKHSPLVGLFEQAWMLCFKELVELLTCLRVLLDKIPKTPVMIQLRSEDHVISVVYDPITQQWSNRDVELLKKYQQPNLHVVDEEKLAKSIFKSFNDDPSHYTGFILRVIASKPEFEKNPQLKTHFDSISNKFNPKDQYTRLNSNQNSLLRIAVANLYKKEFDELLLNSKQYINHITELGETLLHSACVLDSQFHLLKLMTIKELDMTIVDKEGKTAFELMCDLGYTSQITFLLKDPRLDPNAWNQAGRTPLHQACIDNNPLTLKALLSSTKTNPFEPDNLGQSPYNQLKKFSIEVQTLLTQYTKPQKTNAPRFFSRTSDETLNSPQQLNLGNGIH